MLEEARKTYREHLVNLVLGLIIGLGAFGTILSIAVCALSESLSLNPFQAMKVMGVTYFLLPALLLNIFYNYHLIDWGRIKDKDSHKKRLLFYGLSAAKLLIPFGALCFSESSYFGPYFILIAYSLFYYSDLYFINKNERPAKIGIKYFLLSSALNLIVAIGLAYCIQPWLLYDNFFSIIVIFLFVVLSLWSFYNLNENSGFFKFYIAILKSGNLNDGADLKNEQVSSISKAFSFHVDALKNNKHDEIIQAREKIIAEFNQYVFQLASNLNAQTESLKDFTYTQNKLTKEFNIYLERFEEVFNIDEDNTPKEVRDNLKHMRNFITHVLDRFLITISNYLYDNKYTDKKYRDEIEILAARLCFNLRGYESQLNVCKKNRKGIVIHNLFDNISTELCEQAKLVIPKRKFRNINLGIISIIAIASLGLFIPNSLVKQSDLSLWITGGIGVLIPAMLLFKNRKSALLKKEIIKSVVFSAVIIFGINCIYQIALKNHTSNQIETGNSQTIKHARQLKLFLNGPVEKSNKNALVFSNSDSGYDQARKFLADKYDSLIQNKSLHPLDSLHKALDTAEGKIREAESQIKALEKARIKLNLGGYELLKAKQKKLKEDIRALISQIKNIPEDSLKKTLNRLAQQYDSTTKILEPQYKPDSLLAKPYFDEGKKELGSVISFLNKQECAFDQTDLNQINKTLENLKTIRADEFDKQLSQAQELLVFEVNDYMYIGFFIIFLTGLVCFAILRLNAADQKQTGYKLIKPISDATQVTFFVTILLLIPLLKEVSKSDINPQKPFFGLFSFQNWYVPHGIHEIADKGPEAHDDVSDNRRYEYEINTQTDLEINQRTVNSILQIKDEIQMTRDSLIFILKYYGKTTSSGDGITIHYNPDSTTISGPEGDNTEILKRLDKLSDDLKKIDEKVKFLYDEIPPFIKENSGN